MTDKEMDKKNAPDGDNLGGFLTPEHEELFEGLQNFEEGYIENLRERNRFLEDTRRAIFNILEDVAESEEELRKKTDELEKFRKAVDTSFDHTIITDPDGIILYANHAAEILTGYTKEEMLGKRPSLWGHQMPKKFYEILWRTIKEEKQSYVGELTNRRKDGTKFLASIRISPILDKQGEIRQYVGVLRDITEERKIQLKIIRHSTELEKANVRIEEEKERAEGILRFLKSIGEGVFATDADDRIIFMNETAEVFSGKKFAPDERPAYKEMFSFERGDHLEKKSFSPVALAYSKGATIAFPEKSYLLQGEKRLPVSGTSSLIMDGSGKVIGTITVFQDVTKERGLEKMKDSFLSVAAHQLRTPLGSMRWSMEMLLSGDLGKLPKEAKEAVAMLYENSQRMATLVDDLLDVSRIDQGRSKEAIEETDLLNLLKQVMETLAGEAEKRVVTVVSHFPKTRSLPVSVAPKHFYEAMENLLSNAIKYNRPDGSVTLSVEEKEGKLLIRVADTGIGIPKDDQEKVFGKFFRAGNAVLKETEGSGLGLSVVKSYVEECKGRIWFESEENIGTIFFVELPYLKKKTARPRKKLEKGA